MPARMLTVDEVADALQIHPNSLRKELRDTGACCGGAVPAVKIGRFWRIRRDLLEQITGRDPSGEAQS